MEADLSLRSRLILVNVADHLLDRVQASAGLNRRLVRLLCAITGVNSVLVGLRRLRVCLANTFLRAGINILDLAGILCRQIVEFIYPIANRAELSLHVLLASEWIHLAPEAFPGFRLQRLPR